MQKILKFQSNRIYAAPKSIKTYELINRNGHLLTFRVRNPKTRESWKQMATSAFKANETGAFEEVLFSDGTRLRSDALRPDQKKAQRTPILTKEGLGQLIAELAA